uniref:NF-kappa-B inhibitor-like protein 2 n=1 Tax=Ascaris suum TaxID=6253 RepID=F1KTQ4_ASCSU
MLRCAKTIQEQIAASVSVAVTAKELYRYEEAYEYFMKVEMLEAQLNLSNLKRAETAICLANAASNVHSIPNARIMELFEKAESRAVTNTQKIDIYEAMLDFLRKTNAEEDMLKATEEKISEAKRMLEEEDKGDENTMRDEDANSDARSSFSDRWDEANDLMIIERCMAEASQRNVEERIKREKDKRINSYGETRLHEAARSDDQQYLKALIAAGYNVNARDEGGWTPLHEAIGALKLENVRLLLKAGANANLRSREGTLSAEGQPTDSGGLTPLMEACDRGSTAISDVLLQFGANVALKNTDDWTAVDFLRNAISVGMVDEEDISEAERLIRVMEDKLREANIPVSNTPPPKKLEMKGEKAAKSLTGMRQRSTLEQLSPDERNLREYRRMMCVLGRGSSHQHTTLNEAIPSAIDQPIHAEKAVDEILDVDEGLDTLLYGGEDGENSLKRTVIAHPSRSDCIDYAPTKQRDSFDESRHQNVNRERDNFIEEDILLTRRQISSRTRKRNSSPTVIRSSASKMARQRVIELPDSGSDEEPLVGSSRPADNAGRSRNEEDMLASTAVDESTEKLRSGVEKSSASSLMIPASSSHVRPLQTSIHSSCATSNTSMTQQPSTSSRLLLVRVAFMTDTGTRLKTKGIPFPSSSRVGDVRERCISEMRADGEFQSLSLFDGECELDDETPLELITDSSEQIVCRVCGWMPPSAAHIYSTKSTRVMYNILRALGDIFDGCLRLSEMNIGENTALITAMHAFAPHSLSAVQVDGNALSAEFIEAIAKMAADINQLSMNCCQLDSKSVRLLLEIGRNYPQLTDLSMSFNDLSSAAIPDNIASLVHACPILTSLHLASCNLGPSAMSQLVHAIAELHHLEDLDLSQNISVNSAHIAHILNSCSQLSRLNVAATAVTEISAKLNIVSKLCEVNLSLCELCGDAEPLFGWMLQCCDEIISVDLRATNITLLQLDTYCKGKGNKQPVTTLKLAGCAEVESDEGAFISMMKIVVTTDFGVRFELQEEFKNRIVAALPDSFAFCFV